MILEGGSLKTRARLERPASCAKGFRFWCSASMLSFFTIISRLQTVDRTQFCIYLFLISRDYIYRGKKLVINNNNNISVQDVITKLQENNVERCRVHVNGRKYEQSTIALFLLQNAENFRDLWCRNFLRCGYTTNTILRCWDVFVVVAPSINVHTYLLT